MKAKGNPILRGDTNPATVATPRLILRMTGVEATRIAIVAQAKTSAFTAYQIRKIAVNADLTPPFAGQVVASAPADFATIGSNVVATDTVDPTTLPADAIAAHTIDVANVDVLEVWVAQAVSGVAIVIATPTMS